ncbi:DUF1707 domain-containing protein [Catenulispora sp. NL8]|uniref:DUF1707 domain-containing protein n=1 Tax=Catenulispora pinistramenti TaxID=2705254 RepID=A0ABS5KV01_9ACTN|nr:DUF1707 domain-containing protein [Catenulispora pinistramenti]MBS2549891.1 DUF1707 domain-containing protein [Catenulispora pinistramenti]
MTSAPEENQFVPATAPATSSAPAADPVTTSAVAPAADPVATPAVAPAAAPVAAGQVRASDAERDEVAAVLSEALAQGRLTSTELAERIDAAYSATTRAELVPLTADLPDDLRHGPASPISAVERQELTATFSKLIRSGRWVAGRHTKATATFGALIVNLADAVLPGREITLDVNTFCGKAIITVPKNARVVDEGGALFGKRSVTGAAAEGEEDGPLIRITGKSRFGKVVVHRPSDRDHNPWSWEQRYLNR